MASLLSVTLLGVFDVDGCFKMRGCGDVLLLLLLLFLLPFSCQCCAGVSASIQP